jgi:hypothetical protein
MRVKKTVDTMLKTTYMKQWRSKNRNKQHNPPKTKPTIKEFRT